MAESSQFDSGRRGFFSTAAVAAPFLGGIGYGARELLHAAHKNGGKLWSFGNQGKQIFSNSAINPTAAQAGGASTLTQAQRLQAEFYRTRTNRKAYAGADFAAARNRIHGVFDKLIGQPEKHGLLSAAITNAHLSSRSTAEIADSTILTSQPVLNEMQMRDIVRDSTPLMHDERFLRKLSSNLGNATRLRDYHPGPIQKSTARLTTAVNPLNEGSTLWSAFEAQHSEYASMLKGTLGNYASVEAISRNVGAGQIGDITKIRFSKWDTLANGKRKQRFVTYSMIDKNGIAWSGKHSNIRGVGRHLLDGSGVEMPAHIYAAHYEKMLKPDWTAEHVVMLRQDIDHAYIFSNRHSMDGFDKVSKADEKLGLTDGAIATRASESVVTSFPRFLNADTHGMPIPDKPVKFKALNPRGVLNHINDIHRSGHIKTMGDGSYGKGVYNRSEARFFEDSGMSENFSKATTVQQSVSKDVRLIVNPRAKTHNLIPVPTINAARVTHTGESMDKYATGLRIAGVDAYEASLFGDLPSDISTPQAGERFKSQLMTAHNQGILDAEKKMNADQAERIWQRTRKSLEHEGRLDAVRRFGQMGEGSLLHPKGFGGVAVEQEKIYNISNKGRWTDEQIELHKTTPFSSDILLGHDSKDRPVHAKGTYNYIKSVDETEDGWAYTVSTQYDAGTGAKTGAAGVKFENVATTDAGFHHGRVALNEFRLAQKTEMGGVAHLMSPDVNAMAITQFFQDKAYTHQMVSGAANDTLTRIDNILDVATGQRASQSALATGGKDLWPRVGELEQMATKYREDLKTKFLGITQSDGQFHVDPRQFAHFTPKQTAERLEALTQLNRQLMDDAGKHIRAVGSYQDPFFIRFRQGHAGLKSKQFVGDELASFQIKTGAYVEGFLWNHSLIGAAKHTRMTMDMQAEMRRNGYHAALKGLKEDLIYPQGDPAMAADLMAHVAVGDFSKPFGSKSMTMEAAFPQGLSSQMKTADDRKGSVFDPDRADVRENFSIEMGAGSNKRYMPVLGHDAYRGRPNPMPDDGMFSATKLERHVHQVGQAAEADRPALEAAYYDTMRKTMYGKKGMHRAPAVHPKAVTKHVAAGRSTLQNADGSINPFQVTIGEDAAKRMGVAEGGFVSVGRHPISAFSFFQVKIDKSLNKKGVARFDQAIYAAYQADNDGDQMLMYPHKAGSLGAEQAAAAVDTATHSSLQHQQMEWSLASHGIADDISRAGSGGMKSISNRLAKLKADGTDLLSVLRGRTTGKTIGEFSNITTHMQMQLDANPYFKGNAKDSFFLHQAIWDIRQAPISATKNNPGYTYINAKSAITALNTDLEGGAARAKDLHTHLTSLMNLSEKPKQWIPEMLEHMGVPQSAADANGTVKSTTYWLNHAGKESVHQLANTRADVAATFGLVTKSKEAMEIMAKAGKLGNMDEAYLHIQHLLPELQGATGGPRSAPLSAARSMADASVAHLGMGNNATARFKSKAAAVKESFHDLSSSFKNDVNMMKSAKWIGAGVGAAAVLGLMTATPSFDSRRSSNNLRPEEVAGAQDAIPSEPVAGSRSPSNPPRRIQEAPAAPRTSIVTPIQSAVNVDVQMQGEDRSEGIEKLKLAARMSGADSSRGSNFTVINRDNTRMNSLRFKSKMRDTLDQ